MKRLWTIIGGVVLGDLVAVDSQGKRRRAKVIAASATIAAIKANAEKKLATWGPQLKENGPQTLADIVVPEAFDDPALSLEGHSIEIVDAFGLANRRYLRVPSLEAIFGGVLVFSGVHVWTADTQGAEARTTWVKNLEAMAAAKPAVVVPGHMAVEAAIDGSAIAYTRDYLLAFEEELTFLRVEVELVLVPQGW